MCRFSSKNDLPKYCDTLPPAAKSRKLFKIFSRGCEVFSFVMWCQINHSLCIKNCPFSPFLGEKCKICKYRTTPPYNGLWCFTPDIKHLEFSRRWKSPAFHWACARLQHSGGAYATICDFHFPLLTRSFDTQHSWAACLLRARRVSLRILYSRTPSIKCSNK